MIEEIRISSLGVIESSTLELGPGLTVVTGETGAGKTMVVTALGLLLAVAPTRGRSAPEPSRRGWRAWSRWPTSPRSPRPSTRPAARSRTTPSCSPATSRPRAARAPSSVAPRCRWRTLGSLAESLVAVHGQSDQHRLLAPAAQRDALDRFGGAGLQGLLAGYQGVFRALRDCERELDELVTAARERAREADLLRFGVGEVEAVSPQPGEDVELAAEEARLGYADTLRGGGRAGPRGLVERRERRRRRARGGGRGPRAAGRRPRARPRRRRAGRPAGRGELPAERPGGRRRLLRLRTRRRPGAAGGGLRAAGGGHRAHPQVRRDGRRGAGVGGDVVGPPARPRLHRRAHRRADLRPRPARHRARRRGGRAARRPLAGGGRAGAAGHRGAHPARDAPRPPRDRASPAPSPAGHTAPTTSRCCWRPTRGPTRGRCTRVPPAASCRG